MSERAPPATDASGEKDYGHIDDLRWRDGLYELEGDWGRMSDDQHPYPNRTLPLRQRLSAVCPTRSASNGRSTAMGQIDQLADQAGIRTRHAGSLVLVHSEESPALLDVFERSGVRVVGAEGFRLNESQVRPDTDTILDLSDVEDVAESIREARAFVADIARPDLFLEFAIAE